jgi:E3 ubiquitin-protein ligase HUWE1
MRRTGDEIKYGKLSIRFYEEEGVDAGGVAREWIQVLARQMFDPNYALWSESVVSWINQQSVSDKSLPMSSAMR